MSRFKFSGRFFARLAIVASLFASAHSVSAQVVDFETLIATQAVFGFDINDDGIDDVIFSTTAPGGFNTGGPNPDTQVHASGQVLETSSESNPDIRVDFLGGAIGQLQAGFALLTDAGELDQGLRLDVFDEADNQVGSAFQRGELLPITTGLGSGVSGFPEGLISVSFSGVASYALFDATTTGTRFVIDDFSGTFSPESIPEPGSLALVGLGGMILLGRRRRVSS